jgi:hypothetical protein
MEETRPSAITYLTSYLCPELPPNSKVLSVGSGGPSLWVKTVKIVVQLEDGSTTEFFKKVRRTSDFLIFPTEGLRAQC